MFERFTEKARRVIFFARYECSALGNTSIEPEHLMLGLLRESQGIVSNHLKIDRTDFAERLKRLIPTNLQPVSTSVDLPMSDSGRRVLSHASEEAQGMGHSFIGTEHLLLGILREEEGPVAEALRGMSTPTLAETRASIIQSAASESQAKSSPTIYLLDESTGKPLPARLSLQSLPRIGECISFAFPSESVMRYRVIDLEWDLRTSSGKIDPSLHVLTIRLRPDNLSAS